MSLNSASDQISFPATLCTLARRPSSVHVYSIYNCSFSTDRPDSGKSSWGGVGHGGEAAGYVCIILFVTHFWSEKE